MNGSDGMKPVIRPRDRDAGPQDLLVEREHEVRALTRVISEARDGRSAVAVIEAAAGTGRTRLLSAAAHLGGKAGLRVLRCRPTELERGFPFGVVIQLFEPFWMSASSETRAELSRGPAWRAADLLEGRLAAESVGEGASTYPVIHALYRLTGHLVRVSADRDQLSPLVILVDDAHWLDGPSLRFLAYLMQRGGDLPLALVLALRSGEETAEPQAMRALVSASREGVLRLEGLSEHGVETIVRLTMPEADTAFIRACARVTAGNPLLLTQLLDHLIREKRRPNSDTAKRLGELTPDSILNAVAAMLSVMPSHAQAVGRALALLGGGSSVSQVAKLADRTEDEVVTAADALAAAGLLHPGAPLSFVHPLIESAVRRTVAPLDRERAHRRAARVLLDDGAPEERITSQLLLASPGRDGWAVDVLRSAAVKALATGAPTSAVRMLERALAEEPPAAQLGDVLAELGQAEAAAGLPMAAGRLEQALNHTADPRRRAKLTLALVRALSQSGRYSDAAKLMLDARAHAVKVGDDVLDEFDATLIALARFVPELVAAARARAEDVLTRCSDPPTPTQRRALAQVAFNVALAGEPKDLVVQVVERGRAAGGFSDSDNGSSLAMRTAALLAVDETEKALQICDIALRSAEGPAVAVVPRVGHGQRAWALYHQGKITEAEAAAQAAIATARDLRLESATPEVQIALALCHLQRGNLELAEQVIASLAASRPAEQHYLLLLEARAQLRLAQLRPGDALQDAHEAGRLHHASGVASPTVLPWRSTSALALIALGDAGRAAKLAYEELELAESIGATRALMRALRCAGLAERGSRQRELIERAVELGAKAPPRLEEIEALLALGGVLRRANERAAARTPIQAALELARAGGALRLEHEAETEFAATGARSRRALLEGPEALTPSERRVADLAASGLTTREMAETLFVTRKTIEYHLRHIYRKLDVNSRDGLTATLARLSEA